MSGFKRNQTALRNKNLSNGRVDEFAITPDEIDRYEVFSIRPAANIAFWASAGTAGTSAAIPLVLVNAVPDWPRNINFALAGSHGSMVGTLVANGKDQFGSEITETISFTRADNGGTGVGTKVFGQITSGTVYYGTAVGAGTPAIGFVPGTNCLLGLPTRIGAATDVVLLSQTVGTGAVSYGGGTIAAFVDTGVHAVRPAATVTGTSLVTVWVNPTYNNENNARMANLSQAV
jgi:hypothetical protein